MASKPSPLPKNKGGRPTKEILEDKAILRSYGLTLREAEEIVIPSGFARRFLGLPVYNCQAEVMDALIPHGAAVSVRTANEVGKTSVIVAGAILWHLTIFPKGTVVSTAGVFRQVKDQLGPALRRHSGKFPKLTFNETSIVDEGCNSRWVGFSTNDAGKFEGYHGDPEHDAPLMVIVDEAKTVPDPIFEAIERCNPQRLLLASSPGFAEGEFYRSHTKRANFYKTFKITALQCPHIDVQTIKRRTEKYGESHPLVRSMIHAEFMEFVEDAIVSMRQWDNAIANPPPWVKAREPRAFCDFAAGGDENVLAICDGNRVTLARCWRDKNTMSAVGEFIRQFNKHGLKAWNITGDADGMGTVMIDALAEAGWRINRYHNKNHAYDSPYANNSAEMWFEGARKIDRCEVILPDDEELMAQLISRKRNTNESRGRLGIESKEDMKRRGLPSPDRADAVLGAMYAKVDNRSFNILDEPTEQDDIIAGWKQQTRDSGEGVLAGIGFGGEYGAN